MRFNTQTTENLLLPTGSSNAFRRSIYLIQYPRLLEVNFFLHSHGVTRLTKLSDDGYYQQSKWGEPTGTG